MLGRLFRRLQPDATAAKLGRSSRTTRNPNEQRPIRTSDNQHRDTRGSLLKLDIARYVPDESTTEILISRSRQQVVRGFHYQIGRSAGPKFIKCIEGKVLDISFRIGELAKEESLHRAILTPENEGILLPSGYAHGFECISDECTLIYALFRPYNFEEDCVYHPLSFGPIWTGSDLIISERDMTAEFYSP